MSDLETRLTAGLQADAPPQRDPLFRVEVLVRIEQARFRREVRRTTAAAALLAVLASISAPAIRMWIAAEDLRMWIVALAAVAALWALSAVMMAPRFRSAISTVGRLLYP